MTGKPGQPSLECHGMDCCWECFGGRRTHPPGDDYCCDHVVSLAKGRAALAAVARLDQETP